MTLPPKPQGPHEGLADDQINGAFLDLLARFESRPSPDDLAPWLQLVHVDCDSVLCDIEPRDTFDVLARTAREHCCSEDKAA